MSERRPAFVVIKSLKGQFLVFLLTFFVLPLPALLKAEAGLNYLVNLLLIINPSVCFIMNILYCLKNPFLWWAPLICGFMFAPSIPLYYNLTAFPYILFYVVLAYIGAGVGVSIGRNQKKEDAEG